ncbi:gluconokinase [Pseudoduganella guangdongensis]|nr:gluconokinase, GntK/IdnK-type [Pseudoduganella guangdongensis]
MSARWVVMGVSGSGKSSVGAALAEALGVRFVEGDDYHCPANIAKMRAGVPLTDADRAAWLSSLAAEISAAAVAGQGLVLSCSALRRRYRDRLRAADPGLRFAHIHGARELFAQRMQARGSHFMPVALLDSQLAALEPLQPDEAGLTLDAQDAPAELVAAIKKAAG